VVTDPTTTTEWAVSWPGYPDDDPDRYQRYPEKRAREIANLYHGSGVHVVRRTVTYGPWTPADEEGEG
jgi:hypothetical protein